MWTNQAKEEMSKSKDYKTTETHFKVFKTECEKWIDRFNLRSWAIYYRHENHEKNTDWVAWRSFDLTGRIATLGLSLDWSNKKPDENEVRKSAFHEVCELLLARLEAEALVDTCMTQKNDIEEQKHAIIRRLEYGVWEQEK